MCSQCNELELTLQGGAHINEDLHYKVTFLLYAVLNMWSREQSLSQPVYAIDLGASYCHQL